MEVGREGDSTCCEGRGGSWVGKQWVKDARGIWREPREAHSYFAAGGHFEAAPLGGHSVGFSHCGRGSE